VSDQGFDFRPPPPRREARQFEPPPWEQELYDQFAPQAEATKQAAEQEQPQVVETSAVGADAGSSSLDDLLAAVARQEIGVRGAVPPAAESETAETDRPAEAGLDEKQVEQMLIQLRAEEPDVRRQTQPIALAAGLVMIGLGFAVVVWGLYGLTRGGRGAFGATAALILLLFGAGFVGVGAWSTYQALRQRGVL